MIRDARVLQDDHLPREIVHRHDESNHLASALEPVVEGDTPQHAVLSGPSGAGKTCVARATLSRLEEQVLDVHTHHVDCWLQRTGFRVLYKLLEGVGRTYDLHRSSPRVELLDRLRDLEKPSLAVLDEADQIEDPDVLRELYSIRGLTMVVITNREADLLDPLDRRLRSRLHSGEHVSFDAYGDDQLVSILADRVRWGLTPDAVSESHLAWMADAAAGNARDAIGMLRSAARRAEREGVERLRDDHVEAAIPEARRRVRQKSVDRLTDHQRAVYHVVLEGGQLQPKTIHERYADRVEEPRSKRTVRTYLRKLDSYNLVRSDGQGPARVYRPVTE